MSSPAPGWYQDPWRQAPLRWWDGTQWTGHTSDWSRQQPRRPFPGPSRAERLESERKVAPWLRGVLFLWPIATALSLGGVVATVNRFFDDSPVDATSQWSFVWLGQLGSVISIAVLVLRIVWLNRAASLARDLGFDARREPMHAAIGWVIPIVNFWWPYQGMTDCFPEGQRPDRRIAWWWAMSVASGLGLFVVIAVPFVPVGVAAVLVALAIAPALATAALEVGLVGEVLAVHEHLTA
jgi:hypothetical protein